MATLLLFGPARVAAGVNRVSLDARSVAELCDAACARFGHPFAAVLAASALWVNGEPADRRCMLEDGDEVAVVPPVSGGT